MRLLLKVGYQEILFGKGAPIAEIISALDGIKAVDSEGYGESKTYKVKGDIHISVELINDNAICLPDGDKKNEYEAFHALATEKDKLQKKVWELENKLKTIEGAIKP